ncbi:MAG: NADH-quinone oxidoreductase subunit M [bacterium]|nr:NADH-quinone oxidoreductase subunit M [bacterium]
MIDLILPLVTFFPLAALGLLWLIPAGRTTLLKWAALALGTAEFLLSLPLFFAFDAARGGEYQFAVQADWMPRLGVSFHMGMDGIGLVLVLLTTLLLPIILLSSWTVTDRLKSYLMLYFLMTTGMVGVFVSLDFILFYVFWELTLIPMYFLIGIWGGPRRIYAAIKFFLYTMLGSVLMLIAILWIHWATIVPEVGRSFDLPLLLQHFHPTGQAQLWLFGAFALAFAIKVPMFPVHTWLPDAHVEAPTGGSVILAGVLLKMGTYGFLRFALPLFPAATRTLLPLLVALAVIGIVYGALVSIVQRDIKKLVAYSSVSHLGFVMLGLFALNAEGMSGAVLQMVNHGISTGALFLAVGVIYERRHTRQIAEFGGLASRMPLFAFILVVFCLSSVGLPGLNGFVGEFMILLGSFRSQPWATAIAATGVVLAAVYLLWMVQRVLFGPLTNPKNQGLSDLSARELLVFAPLLVLVVWIGVQPQPLLDRINPAVEATLELMRSR